MEPIPLNEKEFKAFGLAGSNPNVNLTPGTKENFYKIEIHIFEKGKIKTCFLSASRHPIKGQPRELKLESAVALVKRLLPEGANISVGKKIKFTNISNQVTTPDSNPSAAVGDPDATSSESEG